jgi:hypothetical protein
MLPFAGIEFGVGRRAHVGGDAEEWAESVEGVESPIEAKRKFVEVGLQMLRANPVVDAVQPRL